MEYSSPKSNRRTAARGLDPMEEIELFGVNGEEEVYRLLSDHFSCVIRNVAVPHGSLYLEKDFLVIHNGVPFVLEVKHWKGEIGCRGDVFYQDKADGTHKELKSPVGTTNQFIRCMKRFYGLDRPVWGVVVFVDTACRLSLPEEMDGVALLPLSRLISFICQRAKQEPEGFAAVDPAPFLRCTRLYDTQNEFCKAILADHSLDCTAEDGALVRLDTTRIRYITVEHSAWRDQEKLYVTFDSGNSGVFYTKDQTLDFHCLDGSWRRFSLSRLRYIVC